MTATSGVPQTNTLNTLGNLANHSRFVQRIRRRYEGQLAMLRPGAPDKVAMQSCLDQLLTTGLDLGQALRVLRQLVVERLVVLDCEQQAPLDVVTHGVTALAEFALDHAITQASKELSERHGNPVGVSPDARNGQIANMWVIGMGKLGARELNVSSDIDLIYV